jgi:hypothetical protein
MIVQMGTQSTLSDFGNGGGKTKRKNWSLLR